MAFDPNEKRDDHGRWTAEGLRAEAARHGNNAVGNDLRSRADELDKAVTAKIEADLEHAKQVGLKVPAAVRIVGDKQILSPMKKSLSDLDAQAAFVVHRQDGGVSGAIYVNKDAYQSASSEGHGTLEHELAHYEHWKIAGSRWEQRANEKLTKEDVILARQVSSYATENYGEFYAEWRSGKASGNTYSPEVDALAKKVFTSGGRPR